MSTGDKLYLVCYEENVVYRGLSDKKKAPTALSEREGPGASIHNRDKKFFTPPKRPDRL